MIGGGYCGYCVIRIDLSLIVLILSIVLDIDCRGYYDYALC